MANEAAALLDELMGKTRNVVPGSDFQETEWWDSEVCKNFLCGFCPSDLFVNTRADIGSCDKIHDGRLRQKYEASDRCGKLGYEQEFLFNLEKIVRALDRRITHGRDRLRKSAEAKQKQMSGTSEEDGVSEKLRHLNTEINSHVTQLEELGQRGEVEEAQVVLKELEGLERERETERAIQAREMSKTLAGFEVDANDFHEKMELCDVCGSFLVIGDSQTRVDAHLLGKQHMGFARIRAAIADLKTKLTEKPEPESNTRKLSTDIRRQDSQRSASQERSQQSPSRKARSHSRERRSRSRERHRRSRSRERRRRSRSRDRRQSHRSRSRDNRRHSYRSRSRDRHRRSRSRERHRRSRSRERHRKSRSRDRDRRSRSRDRRKRSRSRERERERRHRSRSRERDRRRRSRSRDRNRDRRKRSRSRERRHRSRSRENRRGKERYRSHSREGRKSRHKRSSSRENAKRSVSKEKSPAQEESTDQQSEVTSTFKETSLPKDDSLAEEVQPPQPMEVGKEEY